MIDESRRLAGKNQVRVTHVVWRRWERVPTVTEPKSKLRNDLTKRWFRAGLGIGLVVYLLTSLLR